ncbi:hypothetical protein EOW77_0035310 [Bradyrhizobium yuanmingense]|uniref:hypothetical protein n=1 Tax=Bradyrhizobium yuanmingense TaxID=108015 RepID=UPI000FE2FDE4|nr:hypothetical protein [Bradyrhizobium yuanmingense]TGN72956.1 hypothetical protein EOW77_0035310 [Bradyrhizobium yuanmingense]
MTIDASRTPQQWDAQILGAQFEHLNTVRRTGALGRVTAIEADAERALQAEVNLASWPQIDLVSGGGRTVDVGELDVVIVAAASTHPSRLWPDRLRRRPASDAR